MTEKAQGGPDPAATEHELEQRLQTGRAVPSAAFRGALGRRLAAEDPGYGPRPAGLRTTVALLALLAVVLLAVGLLQSLGRL